MLLTRSSSQTARGPPLWLMTREITIAACSLFLLRLELSGSTIGLLAAKVIVGNFGDVVSGGCGREGFLSKLGGKQSLGYLTVEKISRGRYRCEDKAPGVSMTVNRCMGLYLTR